MPTLPVTAIVPDLLTRLEATPNCLLHAPPGAGKTTVVPLALRSAPWLGNRRILMLEPRRLAARAAARFMAKSLGSTVGELVGYRIRHETRISAATRIEVVTEGVLTRLLQADPELADYGIVIFDEFHERSLQADLGLALCIESQAALREDLRLLVMSATLDCAPISTLLGNCPIVSCEGRSFPVTVHHAPPRQAPSPGLHGQIGLAADHVAAVVRHAVEKESGSILVFLPGAGEIRRVADLLALPPLAPDVSVHPLYGDLTPQEQDAAISPAAGGRRKVVLATSIAETSLTIEGIRVVIDAGLARSPRFDPASGMTRLVTERVSLAAALQRQGRAGRLEPGTCYRLWDAAEEHAMRPFAQPEIAEADLAPLVLELAAWGIAEYAGVAHLPWLTMPPSGAYRQAADLLQALGALDEQGRITPHGSAMLRLPLHPRLAHMVLAATQNGQGGTACVVAALLTERAGGRNGADITPEVARHSAVLDTRASRTRKAVGRVPDAILHIERQLRIALPHTETDAVQPDAAGECLALAYPDRIARNRGNGTFHLSGGKAAFLPPEDALARTPFLAVAELDGHAARARIWQAAPLQESMLKHLFADRIRETAFVAWDDQADAVQARLQTRLDALVLRDAPFAGADPAAVTDAVLEGIRRIGLHCLPWTDESDRLRARIGFLRRLDVQPGKPGQPSPWPDLSDPALLAGLETWLAPFLGGISRRSQFRSLNMVTVLEALLDWPMRQRLDREAPTHIAVPSGSNIRIDYGMPDAQQAAPILPVKLQEMFGATETPTIAGGRVPLLLHLLSPAGRPLQVTGDLASFWKNGYPAVRAEMRGRYPKHPWPENPATAIPTRHVKRRAPGSE